MWWIFMWNFFFPLMCVLKVEKNFHKSKITLYHFIFCVTNLNCLFIAFTFTLDEKGEKMHSHRIIKLIRWWRLKRDRQTQRKRLNGRPFMVIMVIEGLNKKKIYLCWCKHKLKDEWYSMNRMTLYENASLHFNSNVAHFSSITHTYTHTRKFIDHHHSQFFA